MLFGKYAGVHIEHLPDDYLEWLAGLCLTNDSLRRAVGQELERRRAETVTVRIALEDVGVLLQLIENGRWAFAARMDPDQWQRLDGLVRGLQQAVEMGV